MPRVFQENLRENALGWNEKEISMHFIGPAPTLAHFTGANVNIFAGREFGREVEGEFIHGKPDGMVATGRKDPKIPFFCLQEYKKNIDPNGDPYGQCLSAVLVAQELNAHLFPIYGLVIVGQQWDFMVLEGKQYAVSTGYIALNDDLLEIFGMLQMLKASISAMMAEAIFLARQIH